MLEFGWERGWIIGVLGVWLGGGGASVQESQGIRSRGIRAEEEVGEPES
jgi:hypothetical protein